MVRTSKCIVLLFAWVLLVCGLVILFMGRLVVGHQLQYIMSTIGMSLVLLGFIGYFGLMSDSYFLLLTFSLSSTLLLLLQIVPLLYIQQSAMNFDEFMAKTLRDLMMGYKNEVGSKEIVDNVQWTLRCCGATNTSDLLHVLDHYPESCCDQSLMERSIKCSVSQYKISCLDAIKTKLLTTGNIISLIVTVMEILSIQLISVFFAWTLTGEYHT